MPQGIRGLNIRLNRTGIDGRARTFGFGDDDQEGLEVVEHVNAVMRKVNLTRDSPAATHR